MAADRWNITPATEDATEAIATLHAESFKAAYVRGDGGERDALVLAEAEEFLTPARLRDRVALIKLSLEDPENEFYRVAHDESGTPIGLIYGFREDDIYEISALYVSEEYFGKGVGEALVASFKDWADPSLSIELGVEVDNERAKNFYTKMGFHSLGDIRKSYFPYLTETTMTTSNQQGEK